MTKPRKTEEFDFSVDTYFYDLSQNQKLAILHFFSVIAARDTNLKIKRRTSAFISQYYKEFEVTGDLYLAYITIGGRKQMIEDIKSLSKDNMLSLVYSTTEMGGYGDGMSDEGYVALEEILDDIGIGLDGWNDLLEGKEL